MFKPPPRPQTPQGGYHNEDLDEANKKGLYIGLTLGSLGTASLGYLGYKAWNKFNLGPKLYRLGQGINKGFRMVRNATANGLVRTANFIRPSATPAPTPSPSPSSTPLPNANSIGHG